MIQGVGQGLQYQCMSVGIVCSWMPLTAAPSQGTRFEALLRFCGGAGPQISDIGVSDSHNELPFLVGSDTCLGVIVKSNR